MSDNTSSASSGGIGLASALFLIFLTLKLTETGVVAGWSWWWVTSPLWISAGLFVVVALIMVLVVALFGRAR